MNAMLFRSGKFVLRGSAASGFLPLGPYIIPDVHTSASPMPNRTSLAVQTSRRRGLLPHAPQPCAHTDLLVFASSLSLHKHRTLRICTNDRAQIIADKCLNRLDNRSPNSRLHSAACASGVDTKLVRSRPNSNERRHSSSYAKQEKSAQDIV